MKNLGKLVVNGAKLAMAGYIGYKLVEGMKKKEESKNEEYVTFDDLEVSYEENQIDVKKVAMIAGGVMVANVILKQQKQIVNLTKQVNENHNLIMNLGEVVDTNVDKTKECIQDMCFLANQACKVAAVNFGELDIRVSNLEHK
jgi:hypothetical protein